MLRIGVTGSRRGMNDKQMLDFIEILNGLTGPVEVHHGDCVGVDNEAATAAQLAGFATVSHPPIIGSLRAFHESSVILQAKPYLDRDRDIVNSTDLLIAFPSGPECRRSGTWYTVRYARKVGKDVLIIEPS